MTFKSQIGATSQTFELTPTEEMISKFGKAICAENLSEVPPTFPTLCRQAEFGLLDVLGLKLSDLLHAEQEYFYHTPIQPEETLTYQAKLETAFDKMGSAWNLHFLVITTEIHSKQTKEKHVTKKTTVVVRKKPSDDN